MNSIDYINQLIQAVNSLNGQNFALRNEIEQVKKEFEEVKGRFTDYDNQEYNKKNDEQVKVILDNMDKTRVMMEEIQTKMTSVEELYNRVAVDGDLDYFKVVSKETSEKLKNLEIALTLKTNTIERNIKNIPKPMTKEEIQSMIDTSLKILLQPTNVEVIQQQELHNTDLCDNLHEHLEPVLSIELNDNSKPVDTDTNEEIEITSEEPVQVVIQSVEPPVSQSKPKRKYTKKSK